MLKSCWYKVTKKNIVFVGMLFCLVSNSYAARRQLAIDPGQLIEGNVEKAQWDAERFRNGFTGSEEDRKQSAQFVSTSGIESRSFLSQEKLFDLTPRGRLKLSLQRDGIRIRDYFSLLVERDAARIKEIARTQGIAKAKEELSKARKMAIAQAKHVVKTVEKKTRKAEAKLFALYYPLAPKPFKPIIIKECGFSDLYEDLLVRVGCTPKPSSSEIREKKIYCGQSAIEEISLEEYQGLRSIINLLPPPQSAFCEEDEEDEEDEEGEHNSNILVPLD